jgi:hypothetical protein
MTPRIRTMSNLFVGCAATGADFAVPGVASSSGVRGVWLAPPFLVVWVWVGCWRLSLCMMYLFYLACLPVLLSVPASCHCDRCFCHPQHAVRSAYLRPRALHIYVRALCALHIYVHTPRTVDALASAFLRLCAVYFCVRTHNALHAVCVSRQLIHPGWHSSELSG